MTPEELSELVMRLLSLISPQKSAELTMWERQRLEDLIYKYSMASAEAVLGSEKQ